MGACNSVVWFGGGESQRSKLISFRANSAKAHCTGKSSYLEPNSGLFHVPIEEVYRITEKTEGRVAIGEKTAQNHVENTARTYLERIRNSMQKPIEGSIRIGVFRCQNHVEEVARVYLERIRNRMHKPIEGLLVPIFGALYKGL